MDDRRITNTLCEIFKKRTGIDFTDHPDQMDLPLFGREIAIPARELVYIYFDIEKELGVSIPQEAVRQGRFRTYREILRLCDDCLHRAAEGQSAPRQ